MNSCVQETDAVEVSGSLIAELEDAIQGGSRDRRVETLRRVTDLFLCDADRLNEQQIEVFDDVLGCLINKIEEKALAELSRRLGPVKNAPIEVIRRLAHDDNVAVAEPVLSQSPRLSSKDLVAIANTKSQAHLLAISGRQHLDVSVTDVLLNRGNQQVVHRVAANTGAQFSEAGFATLVQRSEQDEHLAEKIGLRLDVPLRLLRQLLLRASEAVRSRLLAVAGPEIRDQIQRVLATVGEDLDSEASINRDQDDAQAKRLVLAMRDNSELNEMALLEFARAKKFTELTAALALLSAAPFELMVNLLQSEHREAVLIPCKAVALEWPTVRAILNGRAAGFVVSDHDLEQARADYAKLTQTSAQRVLRFWQVRHSAASNSAAKA
jgi:uncharacterized protein (DUF2336 family)